MDLSISKVLVVGDAMLDKYYFGDVTRISPEAPVPVVNVKRESWNLGGAANVVNNLAHLNVGVGFVAVVGKDQHADILTDLLEKLAVKFSFFQNNFPTITKARVIGGHQQIARLDFEETSPYDPDTLEAIKKLFVVPQTRLADYDVLVISDYAKGVCDPLICEYLIGRARAQNIPVIVDPKGSDWSKYRGATLITPNFKEFKQIVGGNVENEDDQIARYGRDILRRYDIDYLLVTRSERGMSLVSSQDVVHIPTEAREVFDVSGAGDTVIATIAAAYAVDRNILPAVYLANKAAGIVVAKFGTKPIEWHELFHRDIAPDKIVAADDVETLVTALKAHGREIVFTNGCFDILHKGHITYLKEAKKLGDVLIIGLNSDGSVKRLKGDSRPINTQADRAEMLAAMHFVDYVIVFDEDTPYELLRVIQPDVLIKGGDYTVDSVVGREFAKQTRILPFVGTYSTTGIVNKISQQ